MHLKVYLLRRRGRRLVWRDVRNGPHFEGDLQTHLTEAGGEQFIAATLRPRDPAASSPPPDLYQPSLMMISDSAFRLRGFERIQSAGGHQAVVQEWHCELP